jgi:hypothetical protein
MTRDLRQYTRQTTIRLIIGAIVMLFLVGGGLILWIYGSGAAVMGILCLIAGLVPVVLIILILWFLEWIVKRER